MYYGLTFKGDYCFEQFYARYDQIQLRFIVQTKHEALELILPFRMFPTIMN